MVGSPWIHPTLPSLAFYKQFILLRSSPEAIHLDNSTNYQFSIHRAEIITTAAAAAMISVWGGHWNLWITFMIIGQTSGKLLITDIFTNPVQKDSALSSTR